MKTDLRTSVIIASLTIMMVLTSCMGPIPDTGKTPIINPDEVVPVVPKPMNPPPPPEKNPYARPEPGPSDNSGAVLSEGAKEAWDRVLRALEPKQQGADTSANSTPPKVEPLQPPPPPAPAPVAAPPNPVPAVPVVPAPADNANSTAPKPSATPALSAARASSHARLPRPG